MDISNLTLAKNGEPFTGKNYSFLPVTFKNNSIQTVYFFKENNSSKIYAVGGLSVIFHAKVRNIVRNGMGRAWRTSVLKNYVF